MNPMLPARSKGQPRNASRKGVALIIVLTFVVLLVGLVVAFLARSMTGLKASDSSAHQAKAGLLAESAATQIMADFKQEIIAGSTASDGGNPSWPTYYSPVSNIAASPYRTGIPANNAIPNLISRSVRPGNTSGNAPAIAYPASGNGSYVNPPANRAAEDTANPTKVNSTTPSLNGRFISASRWNSHYLIPLKNTLNPTPDSTPVTEFEAPDWVIVTRGGPTQVTWDPNLTDATPTNSRFAIGRYAYAVYDEGGLLDLNVAGYPEGLTSNQTSVKNSVALADLMQLPGMTQTDVNNLVGWRNYASSQQSGSFGNFSFTATTASNWLNNFALNNVSGFMKLPSLIWGNPPRTDQALLSRQQLLALRKSLGFSEKTLQYLGTFSRSLEQPSFIPHPDRPKVVGTTTPPAAAAAGGYVGNNRYVGNDDLVNLGSSGILGVRVKKTFSRPDGSTAVVGEPLVKKKFALSHLQALTTAATAAKSGSDSIYQRFGLYRSSASDAWIYDHGGNGRILYLSEVADLATPREPDFAELLKAAIHAGSLGKAGPSTTAGNYQYTVDTSGDLQILQIMANLIDQQKADNYPTRIDFVDSSGATRNLYGVQDLPYFYRWHYFSVTTETPNPLLTDSDRSVTWNIGGSRTANIDHFLASAVPPTSPGSASYMIIPQLWNPHDANTPAASGGGPTDFRVLAQSSDPSGFAPWKIAAQASDANGFFDGVNLAGIGPESFSITQPTPPNSDYRVLDASNATLQFSMATNVRAFREPTLLWRNNFPTGVSLDFSTNTKRVESASLTGNTYYGILVGDVPISRFATVSINGTNTTCILQTSTIRRAPIQAGISADVNENITFKMQYRDPSGNWVTYQDAYARSALTDIPSHTLFVNAAEYGSSSGTYENRFYNPLMIGINGSGPQLTAPRGGPYDPRSSRFGTPISGKFSDDDPTLNGNPTLDALTKVNNSNPSAAQSKAVGSSNFVLMKTQRPTTARGQNNNYKLPCSEYGNGAMAQMGWYSSVNWQASSGNPGNSAFSDGLLSQNNPAAKVLGKDSSQLSIYYEDADGICRRAMGAYVPVSGNAAGRLTNTLSSIGLPMATSGATFTGGILTPNSQSQSRPILLHRPFRSVGEMSYAFRGTPWKHIDFFTPESGDSAMLDFFCVNEPPADGIVAGKFNLNTRQAPVIQAVLSGAYRDEFHNLAAGIPDTVNHLSTEEAERIANLLISITNGTDPWKGPLSNVADLVGRYYPGAGSITAPEVYQYTKPGSTTPHTYTGFSAALSGTAATQDGSDVWSVGSTSSSRNIQRFRETPIRALSACGQTRVWNLMIDVIAQSGRYPRTATSLDQFIVEGEKRYWVHIAIDRFTGQVIDQQAELVNE
jgi:hypothetical protein